MPYRYTLVVQILFRYTVAECVVSPNLVNQYDWYKDKCYYGHQS